MVKANPSPKKSVSGKHTRFGDADSDREDFEAGSDVGEEFMKGELKDDLENLIKSMKLPQSVPTGQEPLPKKKKERETPAKVEKKPVAPALENQATSTKTPKTKKERKEDKMPNTQIASPDASSSVLKTPRHLRFTESGEVKASVKAAVAPKPVSKGKKSLLAVAPSPHWYNGLPVLSSLESIPQLSPTEIRNKTHRAETLLKEEASYAEENPQLVDAMGTSDRAFLSQILSGGTSSDKLSALTLMAQASPLHNQRALESLKAMAGKKGRQESLKALRALVDLWVGGASPERKLKYLADQPLGHPEVTDKHLIVWAFEDWFKKYFFSLLQILEQLTLDTLPYVRTQALTLVFTLLRDRPEQEQNLLKLMVHKLGDVDKSVASKASNYLLELLQSHPSMKAIVVREVSTLILRPTPLATPDPKSKSEGKPAPLTSAVVSAHHARYYGILAFTQIVLTPREQDVAQLLVTVYFELFVTILGKTAQEEKDQDQLVKPTEGEAGKDKPAPRKHSYRAEVEKKQKAAKKKAGKVGAAGFVEAEDANSKLLAAILNGVNRALPYAKMNETIFDRHIDTLFRITHSATFNVAIQALVLLWHVASSQPSVLDRFYRTIYESLLDPRLAFASKKAMYLNLLFKALKADDNQGRVSAFVKRFLQALSMHDPGFICGALFLLGELFGINPELRSLAVGGLTVSDSGASTSKYDPKTNDPLLAYAEAARLWEIVPLLYHYHPAVSLHARQLLAGETITSSADLSLHSLSSFLDRFVSRAPKKPASRGTSLMQPGTANDGSVLVRQLRGTGTNIVDEKALKHQPADRVPVDQLFFHKFLNMKKEDSKSKGRKKSEDEDSDGGGADNEDEIEFDDEGAATNDEEEEEIWKAMKESLPHDELPSSEESNSEDEDDLPSDLEGPSEDEDEGNKTDGSDSLGDMLEHEDDLIPFDEDASQDEGEWGGLSESKKRKNNKETEGGRGKKRRLAGVPTFASYEDYAKMIDEAPEEDL
ncbi:hypothetical protein FS837_003144 [Tulasnella sp. UAMH 9824]|nr:hypothetical protein FS837_003144 [Tulasnella sp. UAMH 9824]